jgi:Domain of unknown function (DUF4136)
MRSRGICVRVAFAATLFLLAVGAAWGQKVKVGYDKSADFSKYKTYSWIPRTAPSTNPLLATLIDNNIDYQLNQKGLSKVDSNPDLLVKSYGGAEDVKGGWAPQDPNYTASGGAPMPGDNMWEGSLPATPVPQVIEGSITVDLVDAKQKHLVWRATATGKMDYDKRSKLLDQANKAVSEMFKKYPPSK